MTVNDILVSLSEHFQGVSIKDGDLEEAAVDGLTAGTTRKDFIPNKQNVFLMS